MIIFKIGERSSRFGQSCSRAVDALRNIRGRLGRTSGSSAAESEQRSNFAPYELTKKGKKRKPTSWTVKSLYLFAASTGIESMYS